MFWFEPKFGPKMKTCNVHFLRVCGPQLDIIKLFSHFLFRNDVWSRYTSLFPRYLELPTLVSCRFFTYSVLSVFTSKSVSPLLSEPNLKVYSRGLGLHQQRAPSNEEKYWEIEIKTLLVCWSPIRTKNIDFLHHPPLGKLPILKIGEGAPPSLGLGVDKSWIQPWLLFTRDISIQDRKVKQQRR